MLQTFEPQSAPSHYASAPAPVPAVSAPITSAIVQSTDPAPSMSAPKHHHILIVTGPAGCGKSTVAHFLAARYGFTYIEGDDFHPPANIKKMADNIPLDDSDRWDWLILLRDQALDSLKKGATGVVVTCSALKKKYRDVIRTAKIYDEDPNAVVHFIYLRAPQEVLLARVAARQNHYMKPTMVMSQLAALEEPDEIEIQQVRDVDIIDVTGTPEDVQILANAAVDRIMLDDGAVPNTA